MTKHGIHAALIEESERLTIIENLMKEAMWPLSAQEIALSAYPNSNPPKIMLNVSTYIGEMRAEANRDRGHIVSFATTWRVVPLGEWTGKRLNGDGTVTFFVHEQSLWHDGRPRYYLLATPGWTPRWWIDDDGRLVRGPGLPRVSAATTEAPYQQTQEESPAVVLRCMACGKELGKPGPPFCDEECKSAFFKIPTGAIKA